MDWGSPVAKGWLVLWAHKAIQGSLVPWGRMALTTIQGSPGLAARMDCLGSRVLGVTRDRMASPAAAAKWDSRGHKARSALLAVRVKLDCQVVRA